jgi:RES domain-containing protein
LSIAWRLCRAPYAVLDGEGARRFGGRWNSPGRKLVYLADHPALAVLEVLVHLDLLPEDLPDDYVLLRVTLPDQPAAEPTAATAETRAVGDLWLASLSSAVLSVPSVLVPHAMNLLLNPLHPAAVAAHVTDSTAFRFDPRLLRTA